MQMTTTGGGIASSDEAFLISMVAYSNLDHTVDVFTSADGSAGAKVSIHKALAWSALTFDSSQGRCSFFRREAIELRSCLRNN